LKRYLGFPSRQIIGIGIFLRGWGCADSGDLVV